MQKIVHIFTQKIVFRIKLYKKIANMLIAKPSKDVHGKQLF